MKKYYDALIAIAVFVAVITAWYLSLLYIDTHVFASTQNLPDAQIRSLFGDKFGAINSLFSGLALAGIIFTIFLQRRELALQRKDLEETREVFKNQSETLDLQRFENTFFNLLKLHQDVYSNIRLNPSNKDVIAGFALTHLWNQFREIAYTYESKPIKNTAELFTKFSIQHEKALGPYTSTVFYTLQLLDNLTINDKYLYMRIYRAQLSHTEKLILFYNGAQGGINNNLKPLLEKYHMLHLLDTDALIESGHQTIYDQSAFEN